jgi:quinoprotein dehydrogenase-associated probable ABC transporter substrate-binding protein
MRSVVRTARWLPAVALVIAAATRAGGASAQNPPLRVCADPNNLPFSNDRLEGFENEIASVVAKDLNTAVQYTWKPQRRGFVRRTLKAHECDLVVSVPSEYDLLLPTKPYYRSTYVFVYAKNRGLDLRSFDDPVLRRLKIGLHESSDDGANQPPAHALARRGIVGNIVGFRMFDLDSVENPPGKIIDAVASGEIDVAIVWGPFGGYYARRQKTALEVVPVSPALDPPSLPFTFDISMGVRKGDDALKKQIEEILDRRRGDIRTILQRYGVPLVGDGKEI